MVPAMTDKAIPVEASAASPELFPGMTALFDTVAADPATIWLYLSGLIIVAAVIGVLSLSFSAGVR